ncbi:MAG: hypothetical protein C7K11_05245 [Candidatus Amulumruptor caecigallinarius]|nr:MAG: hypothetical protein C7K11_05245 [Candidatus Amulumruptor caecigallinarius]
MAVLTQRSSNIELLRIYAMFFIVFGHMWASRSHASSDSVGGMLMLNSVGIGVVDIFILITGYFLIDKTGFTLVRFFKILFEVMFYNFVIVLTFFALGEAPWTDLLSCLYPLGPTKFNVWFVSQYFALILVQPFLSRLVERMTQRQYAGFLCVMLLLTSVLVPGFPWGYLYSSSWKVSWFITLFLAGGYIRKYGLPSCNIAIYLTLFVALSVIWSAAYLGIIDFVEIGYNSLLTFGVAVSLFYIMLKVRMKPVGWVNSVAGSTFAVYLIHQNHYIVKTWQLYMPQPLGDGFWEVLLSGFLYIAVIFMACVAIDRVRIYLFELCRIPRVQQWLSDNIINKVRHVLTKI